MLLLKIIIFFFFLRLSVVGQLGSSLSAKVIMTLNVAIISYTQEPLSSEPFSGWFNGGGSNSILKEPYLF